MEGFLWFEQIYFCSVSCPNEPSVAKASRNIDSDLECVVQLFLVEQMTLHQTIFIMADLKSQIKLS